MPGQDKVQGVKGARVGSKLVVFTAAITKGTFSIIVN